MLGPLPFVGHHIFLVDTAGGDSAKVGGRGLDFTMTARAPVFVVAVVDDDQGILQSLECLLESADYKVRLFVSSGALLESGCLLQIDCLISDVDMPGTDGFQLVRLVRAARPQLPIILITGYPDRLTRLPALGGSNPRLFTKPFQGHELLEAVSEALQSSR
jgi:FixJ family two-component response regulator